MEIAGVESSRNTNLAHRYAPLTTAIATVLGSVAAGPAAAQPAELEEIVVTATRRSAFLEDVPLSVTVFSQEKIDAQGLKTIDDLVDYTPGLLLNRGANGANDVAIRGISSGSGAGTTGIYIDDTPIQARNLGYAAGSTFPGLFDLERVEVLRGPQGTLFGAGSQGGTIRFIQTTPDLDEPSAYARAEYSGQDVGDASYEGGVAYGSPIDEGKTAYRVSAYFREDGGYIDGVTGTPVEIDPTGALGPDSLTFTDVTVLEPDMNSSSTTGLRAAFKWAPTSRIEIVPSVSYQKIEHDFFGSTFWPAASRGNDYYARPIYRAGDPATNLHLSALTLPDNDYGEDEFTLSQFNVNWDLGDLELFSNTSYFDRRYVQHFDFTAFYAWWYDLHAPGSTWAPRPGDKGITAYFIEQETLTQEFRLQSTDEGARFRWTAGLFYTDADQIGDQDIQLNTLQNAPSIKRFYLPDFLAFVDDGFPYGPGFSAFENHFGLPPDAWPNSSEWELDEAVNEKQTALFGQFDYDLTERLTLTAGLRVSRAEIDFVSAYGGPTNNINAPINTPPTLPIVPFDTPAYANIVQSHSETATTPKIGLSYGINDDNMLYMNAAKGFRPAGVTKLLRGICDLDLAQLGYVNENGLGDNPTIYDSDAVWSYEVGAKNNLLDGKLFLDAGFYVIKWDDIQSSVAMPCGESFVTNLGEAESTGADIGIQYVPTDNLLVSGTIGYNESKYTETVLSPNGSSLVTEGGYVTGSTPPWVYSLSAQYNRPLNGGRELYFRVDVSHRDAARRVGETDPNDPFYNPLIRVVESYSIANLRAGMQWNNYDISIFVRNATNEDQWIGNVVNSPFSGFSPAVWTASTIQPRTIGVFLTYRN
jgi:outer membrane receptor protein involved in Fe transport